MTHVAMALQPYELESSGRVPREEANLPHSGDSASTSAPQKERGGIGVRVSFSLLIPGPSAAPVYPLISVHGIPVSWQPSFTSPAAAARFPQDRFVLMLHYGAPVRWRPTVASSIFVTADD